jgi:hypothetical protein
MYATPCFVKILRFTPRQIKYSLPLGFLTKMLPPPPLLSVLSVSSWSWYHPNNICWRVHFTGLKLLSPPSAQILSFIFTYFPQHPILKHSRFVNLYLLSTKYNVFHPHKTTKKYISYALVLVVRHSSVCIATRYGVDGPGIEFRCGVRFSAAVQTGPGVHPASYTMGIGSSSRG